jgi:hypothetical protein
MAQTFLNLAQGVTGTLPTSNYVQGGISEADQWRLTSAFTSGNTGDITTNLERVDTDGGNYLGTGMSHSSGLFAFPSTGIWYIEALVSGTGTLDFKIKTTQDGTNGNSGTAVSIYSSGGNYSASGSYIFDVTNISTHKVIFRVHGNGDAVYASTGENATHFSFIRLGDT